MGCPKCGYSGHNSVYHWGTGERECDRCGHDYVPGKKSSKNEDIFFKFSASDPKNIRLSNDVWLSPSGKISVGVRTLGSKCIGQKSPLIGDNSVFDHCRNFIGRTFETGGRTYLDRRCW